ncbi:branched-chain amino acid ABC transporter permease [Inconstantimicrobium mannanitabidum]|uniref:Branched-chain amino acid ABC transporter permease n=1 Tax=Inconstantimicrobium mannanitabidum TaxID=1604901 RepID=A0ACB5RAA7_9CLOT|nr:branched-chain amino acid ABC transporter permease [Clostridium sp. TW13]GKX65953.1 branched-chain amino acid ABC transporter permease [Clostridium sp. TW13]
MKAKNKFLNIALIAVVFLLLLAANYYFDSYRIRILNLCAIYTILGLSLNLINGFTGLFSLGHAGFIAIGAYTTALLTMSTKVKNQNFFMEPLIAPLNNIQLPFVVALVIAGLVAALIAFLIGAPALRLKGDYLAIATLGFAEIIRIILNNVQNVTNGALGLRGIPHNTNLYWTFGIAIVTIIVLVSLINSSYGRALKAIREDEIAAESMGISLFKHKVISFIVGAFFAGIGGGLLGSLMGTIDPNMFKFVLTFNIILIIVIGGMGSITGTIISAFFVTILGEVLRFLDMEKPIDLFLFKFTGISGLRMVVFSVLLMIIVLFFRNGIMGTKEITWKSLFGIFNKKPLKHGEE